MFLFSLGMLRIFIYDDGFTLTERKNNIIIDNLTSQQEFVLQFVSGVMSNGREKKVK